MKQETSEPKRELVWPENKDPQALIDFAKSEIEKVKKKGEDSVELDSTKYTGSSGFQLLRCEVYAGAPFGAVVLQLDTYPYTGQAIYIMPEARKPVLLNSAGHGPHFIDTAIPEIKHALLQLGNTASELKSLSQMKVSVNWRDLKNNDTRECTWATPLEMSLPQYPFALVREGIEGEVSIDFTVSESGEVSGVRVKASKDEFEKAVRESVAHWRFEPAIKLDTRLPVRTSYSGRINFHFEEG